MLGAMSATLFAMPGAVLNTAPFVNELATIPATLSQRGAMPTTGPLDLCIATVPALDDSSSARPDRPDTVSVPCGVT